MDRYIALTQAVADSILRVRTGDRRPGRRAPEQRARPGAADAAGQGLLFVGRLSAEKGVPLLLQAWEAAGRPFGTLTVVGDGPEHPSVQAREQQPGSGVVATGPLDAAGVSAALRDAAALVVPSTSPEGMPLVVLEAFAHGRPVLATGRLADVVDPSVGWLAPPSPAGLAAALTEAAATGSDERGAAARARYQQRYSPDVVIAAQLAIYRDVLAERR